MSNLNEAQEAVAAALDAIRDASAELVAADAPWPVRRLLISAGAAVIEAKQALEQLGRGKRAAA